MTRLPELPQVFQRAWRSQAPKSPSRPHLRPSQPRGITPRPAEPRQAAARSPARPVRKEEPARRPRGCVYLSRRGLRPRLQAPGRPPPHSAPLAPTAAAPALATATFIFLNYIVGKAKAKTAERRARARARGERRARAGGQRRGASGLRVAGRAARGLEPGPPERPGSRRTGPRAAVGRGCFLVCPAFSACPRLVAGGGQAPTAGAPSWVPV